MKNFIVSLVAVLALSGCLPPAADEQGPVNPINETGVVNQVFSTYRSELKNLLELTAEKIESGELKTEVEVNQFIHDESKKIREDAFYLLNQDVEKRLSGDKWTKESAANYWREQGGSL